MSRPYDALVFPPARFTAGHSGGHGGPPETVLEQLQRAHSHLLGVAKSRVHSAVLDGVGPEAIQIIARKGYAVEEFNLPGVPNVLYLVTWEPRL